MKDNINTRRLHIGLGCKLALIMVLMFSVRLSAQQKFTIQLTNGNYQQVSVNGLKLTFDNNGSFSCWQNGLKQDITFNSVGLVYFTDLNVEQSSYYFVDSLIICERDSVLWHGNYLKNPDSYYANYTTIFGLDSIYKITLKLLPNPMMFNIVGPNSPLEQSFCTYSTPESSDLVYTWSVTSGNIISHPSDNSVEIQWGNAGEGALSVYSENQYGCKSDTVYVQITIGLTARNDINNTGIVIYPNPANKIIYIATEMDEIEVEIVDMVGKKVLISERKDIDISKFRSGLYIIRILDHDGILIKRKLMVLSHL